MRIFSQKTRLRYCQVTAGTLPPASQDLSSSLSNLGYIPVIYGQNQADLPSNHGRKPALAWAPGKGAQSYVQDGNNLTMKPKIIHVLSETSDRGVSHFCLGFPF